MNGAAQLVSTADQAGLRDGMSVDVEDYFHVEAFADRVSFSQWPSFQSRVRRNTESVLELFARYSCRATFFVLGWVAERDPQLVREIADAGHELGCHSYAHRRVDTLTAEEFREDLMRARGAIEDASGTRVAGYRAPTFSIVKNSLWALRILAEEGFLYDSSIFPIRHDLYGFPDAPRWPHEIQLADQGAIFEIPMSTVRIWGQNLPVGGGGSLRLLPMAYTRRAIGAIHIRKHPLIVYFHPWEIDPEQPRVSGSLKSRLRHYTGLNRMRERLNRLLESANFGPLIDLVPDSHKERNSAVATAGPDQQSLQVRGS
jgi:polysaccharide deacetylase family protein (PEP-CTERM system associated)